jgi:UDP-3-O-[3-hydroxymyristoyl] glucosamine N-acyltransferase
MMMLAFQASASVNKSVKIPDGGQADGASSVNGSVTVGTYATISGDLETVNGSIRIGEGTTLGDAETVNGSLRVGDSVRARNLETVNGKVQVGANVTIDGEVTAVNGKIEIQSGSQVARNVENVNGQINLSGARVAGGVTTVNGSVYVVDGAIVRGDLKVRKPNRSGWTNNNKKPKVVIGPGSRVEGVIDLEQEVRLYISETAEVGGVTGVMSLDDAERFSGDRP